MPLLSPEWINRISVPIAELDDDGAVYPNPLFHRSFDKLHSRCVEYPFAASRIGSAKCILDVGTAQADPLWISWLNTLPIEVHATDYTVPTALADGLRFHQADIRHLPLSDNTFDRVLAISVVEHIGLSNPQVEGQSLPSCSSDGDIEAVTELARVLKPDGELVMTLPFGVQEGLVLRSSARCYTRESIRQFEASLLPVSLDYYEYQWRERCGICQEFSPPKTLVREVWNRLASRWRRPVARKQAVASTARPGRVTWRRVPMADARATHYRHVDGIVCGVWRKP